MNRGEMMYEVSFDEQEMKEYPNPHKALEVLRDQIKAKLDQDEQKYEWYDITATNEGKSLKITAVFSEQRKKHFEENPI